MSRWLTNCAGCHARCCNIISYGDVEAFVFPDDKDLNNIAAKLRTTKQDVIDKYCTITSNGTLGLKIIAETGNCVFLDEATNMCGAYPNSPQVCQTYASDHACPMEPDRSIEIQEIERPTDD